MTLSTRTTLLAGSQVQSFYRDNERVGAVRIEREPGAETTWIEDSSAQTIAAISRQRSAGAPFTEAALGEVLGRSGHVETLTHGLGPLAPAAIEGADFSAPEVRTWLAQQAVSGNRLTAAFAARMRARGEPETLRKYYEVSGVQDTELVLSSGSAATRGTFSSSYRELSTHALARHHSGSSIEDRIARLAGRGGTLEQVDTLSDPQSGASLVARRCGCHGYAEEEQVDLTTREPSEQLLTRHYSAHVEHRDVGGVENLPDHFTVLDTTGAEVGRVSFTYPNRADATEQTIDFALKTKGGMHHLATVVAKGSDMRIDTAANWPEAEALLADLLVAMPTQLVRRYDSRLSQVEETLDAARVMQAPDKLAALAAFMQPLAAGTATAKVAQLLGSLDGDFGGAVDTDAAVTCTKTVCEIRTRTP